MDNFGKTDKECSALTSAVLALDHVRFAAELSLHVNVNQCSQVYDKIKQVWRVETALVTACRLGLVEFVLLLLQHGAHVDVADDNLGKSALHWACYMNQTTIVSILLQHGASVNLRDYVNETPVVEAIGHKNCFIVELLLNRRLNINMTLNYDRDTALLLAQTAHLLQRCFKLPGDKHQMGVLYQDLSCKWPVIRSHSNVSVGT